jgi:hypothetical protein
MIGDDGREHRASQKRAAGVTCGHEIKAYLRLHLLLDSCLRLLGLGWNRRVSTRWALSHRQVPELWMEFRLQP